MLESGKTSEGPVVDDFDQVSKSQTVVVLTGGVGIATRGGDWLLQS